MMTKTTKLTIASLFVAIAAGYAAMAWVKPGSYEECIFERMKDAHNDKAAIAIAGACRKQFPESNYFDKYDKDTR